MMVDERHAGDIVVHDLMLEEVTCWSRQRDLRGVIVQSGRLGENSIVRHLREGDEEAERLSSGCRDGMMMMMMMMMM